MYNNYNGSIAALIHICTWYKVESSIPIYYKKTKLKAKSNKRTLRFTNYIFTNTMNCLIKLSISCMIMFIELKCILGSVTCNRWSKIYVIAYVKYSHVTIMIFQSGNKPQKLTLTFFLMAFNSQNKSHWIKGAHHYRCSIHKSRLIDHHWTTPSICILMMTTW